LDAFTAARRANADRVMAAIGAPRGVTRPPVPAGSEAAWLRLPLLVHDAGRRARLLAELTAAGIGATGSYPAALADVPELQPSLAGAGGGAFPGARTVASRIVTLPTHPYVSAADVATMARIVRGVAGGESVPAAVGAATS
jgi:perosamine synthetase